MIRSYKDYLYYLECDRIALEQTRSRPRLLRDEEWRCQRLLRRAEYLQNCGRGFLARFALMYTKLCFHRLSVRIGFHLPLNVFGPGLSVSHYGSSTGANPGARVGANCRLHSGAAIVTTAGSSHESAQIGNNVYVGPYVQIIGPIRIADGIVIGANAVVNRSFEEPNITIAGVPARKISDKGSEGLLVPGCTDPELLKQWSVRGESPD